MADTKKRLYAALVLVDEFDEVKEGGAAVRYVDKDGNEQTKQAPMFAVEGNTSDEIIEQFVTRLSNGFAMLEPILVPKKEKSIITKLH